MQVYLSSIEIGNLKSIRRERFPLTQFTPLIGANNTGKTNILLGIGWWIKGGILDDTFFRSDRKPVEVTAEVAGLNDQAALEGDYPALLPYLQGDKILVRRVQRRPSPKQRQDSFQFQNPGAKQSEPHWKEDEAASKCIRRLFPNPIFIHGMQIPDKGPFSSEPGEVIHQLLQQILGPAGDKIFSAFRHAFNEIERMLDPENKNCVPEIRELDSRLNDNIEAIFPGIRLQLEVPAPNMSHIINQTQLKIWEDGFTESRNIEAMGQGARRVVQMALLRYLAKSTHLQYGPRSCSILLIEEPELHLHPQAVELIRAMLKKLAQGRYQIIFATHSAQMVTAQDVQACLLIRKDHQRGTYKRERMEDAVKRVENKARSQVQLLFSLSNSNEMLFADRILLAEGKTERRLIPAIYESITGESLAFHRLALVRLGGVSNTRKSMLVLNAMDLPAKALVDLDYAFTDAARDGFLDKNDPDIKALLGIMAKIAPRYKIRLVNHRPVTRQSSMKASEAWALMAKQNEAEAPLQRIHEKLKEKKIWIWTHGSIEDHLGLDEKNETAWAHFLSDLSEKSPMDVIRDYQGVRELMEWLSSA